MKSRIYLFLILSSISFLFAEEVKPRILSLPIENTVKNESYDILAGTIRDILQLSLKLIGRYDVISSELSGEELFAGSTVTEYANTHAVDNIIWGSLSLNESGKLVMSLYLFERASASVVSSPEETAENALGVFDATDNLVVKILGSLSDEHIAFGSLNFLNTGEKGRYQIYFDNTAVAENSERIDRVLNGSYDLEIRQIRFGLETVLYRENIQVLEGEEKVIEFAVPYLTDKERERLAALAPAIDTVISTGSYTGDLRKEIDILLSESKDLSFCPAVASEIPVISLADYRLSLEENLREGIKRFNLRLPMDPCWFSRKMVIPEELKTAELQDEAEGVLESLYLLQRLEEVSFFEKKYYTRYPPSRMDITQLAQLTSNRFADLYSRDRHYIDSLYKAHLEEEAAGDQYQFNRIMEKYYRVFWKILGKHNKGRLEISREDIPELMAKYQTLKPASNYTYKYNRRRTLLGRVDLFGGTLVTGGFQWRPGNSWFALRSGVSTYWDFSDTAFFSIPIELDLCQTVDIVTMYTGFVLDLPLSYYGNGIEELNKYQAVSDDSLPTAFGFNIGMDLNLGRISLTLNNYLYMMARDLADSYTDSSSPAFVYSPSIGVLF